MKVLGIIPARFSSTRLAGKPLVEIAGKSLIERVYKRAAAVLDHVVVATDHKEIFSKVISFGGKAVMTSEHHETGTNRCLEAFNRLEEDFDVILNIQGDEPLLEREHIEKTVECFEDGSVEMASLAIRLNEKSILKSGEGVYVVMDKNHNALYFSRNIIPFLRDIPQVDWAKNHTYYKHIGMYGFRPEALKKFSEFPESSLENAEKLEQNRWLENGRKIKMGITEKEVIAVDTPADLEKVRRIFEKENYE